MEKVLFLAKRSSEENPIERLGNGIRHFYDIHKILELETVRQFIESDEFEKLLTNCLDQEKKAKGLGGGDWLDHSLGEAPIFKNLHEWSPALEREYKGSFGVMVCGELPRFSEVKNSIMNIREKL